MPSFRQRSGRDFQDILRTMSACTVLTAVLSLVRHGNPSFRAGGDLKWPGRLQRSSKFRWAWRSTCTPARLANKRLRQFSHFDGGGPSVATMRPQRATTRNTADHLRNALLLYDACCVMYSPSWSLASFRARCRQGIVIPKRAERCCRAAIWARLDRARLKKARVATHALLLTNRESRMFEPNSVAPDFRSCQAMRRLSQQQCQQQ
jgi:hypothetical protein